MLRPLIGRNVPIPTSSTSDARLTPRAWSCDSSAGVKCSEAVGAATLPGTLAKTVW